MCGDVDTTRGPGGYRSCSLRPPPGGYRCPVTNSVDAGRRQLLLALAGTPLLASALAACADDPEPKSAPAPRPDVDVKVRWRAIRGEQNLLALYAAVVAAHPTLAARLTPLQQHHEDHLAALQAEGPLPFGATDPPAVSAVPSAAPAALIVLRDTEHAQSESRVADCLAAAGPKLAAMLASIAACEAAHEAILGSA